MSTFDFNRYSDCKKCASWAQEKSLVNLADKVSHCNVCRRLYLDQDIEEAFRKTMQQKFPFSADEKKKLATATARLAYRLFLEENKMSQKIDRYKEMLSEVLVQLKKRQSDISRLRHDIVINWEASKNLDEKAKPPKLQQINVLRNTLQETLKKYDEGLALYRDIDTELQKLFQKCEKWALAKKYPVLTLCTNRIGNVGRETASEMKMQSGWMFPVSESIPNKLSVYTPYYEYFKEKS